ncbi:hypothetical protein AMECASPLE_028937, partial [Ameca splendens]
VTVLCANLYTTLFCFYSPLDTALIEEPASVAVTVCGFPFMKGVGDSAGQVTLLLRLSIICSRGRGVVAGIQLTHDPLWLPSNRLPDTVPQEGDLV